MRKKSVGVLILGTFLFTFFVHGFAQTTVFKKVVARVHKNSKMKDGRIKDRRFTNDGADLYFYDGEKRLEVKCKDNPLNVSYDDIEKIVFDEATGMKGGGEGFGLIGAAVASGKRTNNYFYIEYKVPDKKNGRYMLIVKKNEIAKIKEKTKSLFGDKVKVAEFTEKCKPIPKGTLKEMKRKTRIKVDKKNHPLPPGLKPDKALVVMLCISPKPRYIGKGPRIKVHANDKVIGINKVGTYCFTYLDPGDYRVVSQCEDAWSFNVKMEAGKDYYFIQTIKMGMFKPKTRLFRNTKEVVMFEIQGAHFSDWGFKN